MLNGCRSHFGSSPASFCFSATPYTYKDVEENCEIYVDWIDGWILDTMIGFKSHQIFGISSYELATILLSSRGYPKKKFALRAAFPGKVFGGSSHSPPTRFEEGAGAAGPDQIR